MTFKRPRHSWRGGFSAALTWIVAPVHTRLQRMVTDLDLQAVQKVCGRCHDPAMFQNEPRSWGRWNDVFADMTRRGANGTGEQLARVTEYFLENLTLVNVNSSPADELAWVLDVGDDVAQAIIARRRRQPFAGIAQLRAVPGVDPSKLEQRKSRILF